MIPTQLAMAASAATQINTSMTNSSVDQQRRRWLKLNVQCFDLQRPPSCRSDSANQVAGLPIACRKLMKSLPLFPALSRQMQRQIVRVSTG